MDSVESAFNAESGGISWTKNPLLKQHRSISAFGTDSKSVLSPDRPRPRYSTMVYASKSQIMFSF